MDLCSVGQSQADWDTRVSGAPVHRWSLIIFALPLSIGCAKAAGPVQVVVDARITHQVMEGFGSSVRVWGDPHLSDFQPTVVPREAQDAILRQLYTDLRLTRARSALDADIEPTNDNDDPFTFDWSRFNFEGKRTDAHVAFVKQAMPYGLQVSFPSPVILESWMTEGNPEEYVEWALAILLRWRHLGLDLPFYSIINEPGHTRVAKRSAQWLRAVVKSLGARMRAEGLRTMLVIPDDLNPKEAYPRSRAVLEDPEARQYVGALAYHLYSFGSVDAYLGKMRDLSLQYRVPVWMTEWYVAATTYEAAMQWVETVHKLIADYRVSAVDHMWGFFGSWINRKFGGGAFISIDFERGRYVSHRLEPVYYLMGQFTKFIRRGYVRIEAHSSSHHVRVTSYQGDNEVVMVAINADRHGHEVEFSMVGMPIPTSFTCVRSGRSERWRALSPIVSNGSHWSVDLPPESVTTLIGALPISGASTGTEDR